MGEALEKHGFALHEKALGMVRSSEPLPGEDCDYEIRQIETKYLEQPHVQEMIEKSYGMPEGTGKILVDLTRSFEEKTDVAQYMVFDGETPIAFGNVMKAPGTNYGLLSGAATLPEYRGEGIYTSLLRKRIDTAREMGLSHLIIQGKEETSAPIAAKNGFEKLSEIEIYTQTADQE